MRDYLRLILELAYSGHPDGRETRLEMIRRYAEAALKLTEAEWRRTFQHWPHKFRSDPDGWCLECGEVQIHKYHRTNDGGYD
jgi:hypothetical protein